MTTNESLTRITDVAPGAIVRYYVGTAPIVATVARIERHGAREVMVTWEGRAAEIVTVDTWVEVVGHAPRWEDALITPEADTPPAPRYTVTTNHPNARAPYAYADTRADAIRLAYELHALREIRAANGLLTGAVLVRDREHAHGGAFIFRIDADGTARTL